MERRADASAFCDCGGGNPTDGMWLLLGKSTGNWQSCPPERHGHLRGSASPVLRGILGTNPQHYRSGCFGCRSKTNRSKPPITSPSKPRCGSAPPSDGLAPPRNRRISEYLAWRAKKSMSRHADRLCSRSGAHRCGDQARPRGRHPLRAAALPRPLVRYFLRDRGTAIQ